VVILGAAVSIVRAHRRPFREFGVCVYGALVAFTAHFQAWFAHDFVCAPFLVVGATAAHETLRTIVRTTCVLENNWLKLPCGLLWTALLKRW